MLSIKDAIEKTLSELQSFGIDRSEARQESYMILSQVCGLSTSQIFAFPENTLSAEEEQNWLSILERRKKREPLQYILGDTCFWGLRFLVAPGVFIPRPDTECLVEAALKLFKNHNQPLEIAEIGIGSGAISVSLLHSLKNAQISAVELSPEAYDIALQNARLHNVDDRLNLTLADWRAWISNLASPLDALISNPPYIPRADEALLAPEVRSWEPELALYGSSSDGLGFYRELAELGPELFKDNGFIALEFGDGQAAQVLEIFCQAGWLNIRQQQDLLGLPRVLTAFRKENPFEDS